MEAFWNNILVRVHDIELGKVKEQDGWMDATYGMNGIKVIKAVSDELWCVV